MKKSPAFTIIVVLCTMLLSLGFSGTGLAAQHSEAAQMAELLPDGVLGFVTTSGGKAVSPAFGKSTMGQLWNSPDVQDFADKVWDQLYKKFEQENLDSPEEKEDFLLVKDIACTVLQCPAIACMVEKPQDDNEPIYGLVIVNAGDLKPKLAKLVKKVEAKAEPGDLVDVTVGKYKMRGVADDNDSVYFGWAGKYFVLAVNDTEHVALKRMGNPNNGVSAKYFSRMKDYGDAGAMFIDFKRIKNLIITSVKKHESEEDIKEVTSVLDNLGLMDVNGFSARLGFDKEDMVSNMFINLVSNNKGIWAAIKPVDKNMLNVIDKDSMGAFAMNFNFAGFYDTILTTIKQVAPQSEIEQIDKGIDDVEQIAGFKIRDGLLASLDGPVVAYTMTPGTVLDAPKGSVVVIAKTSNAAELKAILEETGKKIALMSDGVMQVSQAEKKGVTYNYWTAMPLAMVSVLPSWTIHEDYLVIGTTAATTERAVNLLKGNGQSLLSRPDVKARVNSLPKNFVMFKYSDSKSQIRHMLLTAQQFWPLLTMGLMQEGIQLPAMLPQATEVIDSMTPSYEYAWYDNDGLRSHYDGCGIEISTGAIAGGAMGAAILMPALGKAKVQAKTVVSANNLKQIGLICHMYANDNDGKFPEDLSQDILADYGLDENLLKSPRMPDNFNGSGYIYIAGLTPKSSYNIVLAYENPEYFSRSEKINTLYCDGHVQAIPAEMLIKDLKKTYELLGKKAPELKFAD